MKRTGNYKKGKDNPSFTHGMCDTPTWNSWRAMKYRATKSDRPRDIIYRKHGMVKRWLKFENFLADMGERPEGTSIERKDNSKGYKKSNCKWATKSEQNINKKHWNKPNKNGFKGLKLNSYGFFEVCIKGKYIGRSKCKIEAAKLYNKHAKELFGTNAKLNNVE